MHKEKLRIFIGPMEISNIGVILSRAFRERGISVSVVSTGKHQFRKGVMYDEILCPPDIRRFNYIQKRITLIKYWIPIFLKYFIRNDAFIFLFGNSLFPKNLDLPLYRLFGKKTIMWFLGSDIKDYEKRRIELEGMGVKYIPNNKANESENAKKNKRRMIKKVEKYVDHLITGPSIAQLLTRSYYGENLSNRIYMPFDLKSVNYQCSDNPEILIIHAPSNQSVKGTTQILDVISRLRDESYVFEFRLLQNTSSIKVRQALTEADIAIDQLFAYGPGMFALEAMASGCAVLGGNLPAVSCYPLDLPILHTDTDNIYSNLKKLLDNSEYRKKLAEKGRKYVEMYHDSNKIAGKIIKILSH